MARQVVAEEFLMQAEIRNVGPWEMKCIEMTLVSSWKRPLIWAMAAMFSNQLKTRPKMAEKGESHEYSTHCSPERELKPRIVVFGVGGAGCNAVNNMIAAGLEGVDFVVANTDAQSLSNNAADRRIQIGSKLTEGLGAGADLKSAKPLPKNNGRDCRYAARLAYGLCHSRYGRWHWHGAAPVIARAAREQGILTVGVITKPFDFEGGRRMRAAIAGIEELAKEVDTLIIIPNQNLFRIANAQTTLPKLLLWLMKCCIQASQV